MAADFSSAFFMKDFVFLNPKSLSGGRSKELADVLLVAGEECIVISVKGTDGKVKSDQRLKSWLRKNVRRGSKAAKTGIQRFAKLPFSAENLWGERKEFAANSLRPQCGIVLLECSQELFKVVEFEVIQPKAKVPLHFLSLNDFLNLVMWLGSIWDVFHYFSKRAAIIHTFNAINQERPVLAYYTLRSHEDLSGVLLEDKEKLCEMHQLHLLDNLANYGERDRLAGYVNAVVHELHSRHPSMETFVPPELMPHVEPTESRSAYLKMAAMLNALPSSNKVWIGRRIESLLKTLRRSGKGGCFAFKRLYGEPIFVFACFSQFSRTKRIRTLHRLLPAGLYRYQANEGLGIVFDADGGFDSGFDIEWIRGLKSFDQDVRRLGEMCFGETETLHANPFGEARPYTPKNPRAEWNWSETSASGEAGQSTDQPINR
jgi:hypothetical protein